MTDLTVTAHGWDDFLREGETPAHPGLAKPGSARRRERLRRRGAASLSWLTRNLHRFAPWQDGRPADARLKAFAELSILYAYLEQWQGQPFAAALSLAKTLPAWRAFLTGQCEHRPYAEMARKHPAQAYAFLLPYLMLRATGYRSPYHEDTFERLRHWGYPEATEAVPYRQLERRYILWKSGYLPHEPSWLRLYRDTVLARSRSPVHLDQDAAYSVTHTLFYLTDMGNRPAPFEAREVDRVTGLVECLLVHYWRLAHWDLVGELLVCLNCLHKWDSDLDAQAAKGFLRAWRSDGAVPAERRAAEETRAACGAGQEERAFRECYHTTLVGVFYCCTGLNEIWR